MTFRTQYHPRLLRHLPVRWKARSWRPRITRPSPLLALNRPRTVVGRAGPWKSFPCGGACQGRRRWEPTLGRADLDRTFILPPIPPTTH